MPLLDWILALITIFAWGMNFLVSKLALFEIPPLLFGFWRFVLVAFPAVFFVKFPKAPWKTVLAYGLTINFLQFSFMLSSIAFGLAAGMTSLLLQIQVFFTVILSASYFKEKIPFGIFVAFIIAAIGIVLIIEGASTETALPIAGILSVIAGAFFWATGNITIKMMPGVNMISLVVWGSLFSLPAFAAASFIIDGPEYILHGYEHMTYKAWIGIAYGAYISTFVGYVLWGKLLSRRPVSLIAPLTLLIPIIGFASNSIAFDEHFTWVQWLGAAFVLLALCVNVFWFKILKFLRHQK
ncbi:EamA family transporter [Pelistega europaea]|uniref:EamA family transporter n=1 Tax=Pelistega europaea TaxID=106147 RepID=A0A7Y4P5E0_9BURK|nr:EamA family transporter [Pelistega europaea]